MRCPAPSSAQESCPSQGQTLPDIVRLFDLCFAKDIVICGPLHPKPMQHQLLSTPNDATTIRVHSRPDVVRPIPYDPLREAIGHKSLKDNHLGIEPADPSL